MTITAGIGNSASQFCRRSELDCISMVGSGTTSGDYYYYYYYNSIHPDDKDQSGISPQYIFSGW